jgi:hypothetical protein
MEWSSEEFLKANANPNFIAAQFADVVRDLMRAIAAGDPSHGLYHVSQRMNLVIDLWKRCPEELSAETLLYSSLRDILGSGADGPVDEATTQAARSGLKYLIEKSCHDQAARGRASRRETEFLRDVEFIEETRVASGRK